MSILDENIFTQGSISPRMRSALASMAPWLRFIGLSGLIFSSLFFIIIVVVLVVGISNANLGQFGAFAALPGFVFGIYLAFIALGMYLHFLLWQAGNQMKRFALTNDQIYLEEAFVKQKNFWTIIGVLLAIYLGFIALAIFIGVITAILA